jgi:hypothetical protein
MLLDCESLFHDKARERFIVCESQSHIRLCSCASTLDASKPIWVLYSKRERGGGRIGTYVIPNVVRPFGVAPKSPRQSIFVTLGLSVFAYVKLLAFVFFIPFLIIFYVAHLVIVSIAKRRLISFRSVSILKDLNNHDVFDFSYQPSVGDVLVIHAHNKVFVFEFSLAKKWHISSLTSKQLADHKRRINSGFVAD